MLEKQISTKLIIAKALILASTGEASQPAFGGAKAYRHLMGQFGVEFVAPRDSEKPGYITVTLNRWEVFRAALTPGFEKDLSRHEVLLIASRPDRWRENFMSLRPHETGSARASAASNDEASPAKPVNWGEAEGGPIGPR